MKALILAAGYATRLYPLTLNRPKPLLPVGGKPLIEHLMALIGTIPVVDGVYIVSNHRFAPHFHAWAASWAEASQAARETRSSFNSQASQAAKRDVPVTVLDDGSTSVETRLGAVGDMHFAMREASIDDDVLVLAGDNLFVGFDLGCFVGAFTGCPDADAAVTVVKETRLERLRRTGVAVVDPDGWVSRFVEKPHDPPSQWAVPPVYLFRRGASEWVHAFLAEGNEGDAPGHFIAWLAGHRRILAHPFDGTRYDIGTLESYREVERLFQNA